MPAEKVKLQAEAMAAEEALKKAEARAAADIKKKRELERELARQALQQVKWVECDVYPYLDAENKIKDIMFSALPKMFTCSIVAYIKDAFMIHVVSSACNSHFCRWRRLWISMRAVNLWRIWNCCGQQMMT